LCDEVNEALQRILASDPFLRSERLTHFLSYVVEKTLQGQSGDLKEYHIGVEVCGRRDSYDTRTDPVVRVEARRLRSALDLYYAHQGKERGSSISLPKGGYVPCFSSRKAAGPPPAAISTPVPARPEAGGWDAAGCGWNAVAAGAVYFLWTHAYNRAAVNTGTLVLADFTNTTGDVIFDHALRQGWRPSWSKSPI